jgi:NAD(P)-dependent dehydrogenase (short-subunit alcohol dehydrogenase family)
MLLQQGIAVVTGGARGIGCAIAVGLAREGAAVAIGDRDSAGAGHTAAAIRASGARAFADSLDVTEIASCKRFAAAARDALGHCSILINNAGGLGIGDAGSATSLERWRDVMRVNLAGCMIMTEALLPQLRATRGCIVNMSSTSGILASPDSGAYSASKAALLQYTRVLAVELGSAGIRANAVGPGAVRTAMKTAIAGADARLARYVLRTPLGRIDDPEDIVGPE